MSKVHKFRMPKKKKKINYTSAEKRKRKKFTNECLVESSDLSSTNTWGREMWRVRDKARCVGRCLTGSRVTSTPSPKNWDYTLYTKGREDPRRTAWCSDRHGNQDWQRLAKQMAMQTGKSLCCARCSSGTRLTWAGGNRGRRDPPERQHTR